MNRVEYSTKGNFNEKSAYSV